MPQLYCNTPAVVYKIVDQIFETSLVWSFASNKT